MLSRPLGPVKAAMPLGRSSIPHVAFVILDFIGLEERAEFLLKSLDSVVLALVADVGPHFFDLRLAHRERPESSLPEESLELRALTAKPIVRAFLEVSDNVAQSLGPGEKKQGVQVVGLGVDFDRKTAKAFERAAHVRMEVDTNLVRHRAFAALRRKDALIVVVGVEL